LRDSRATELRSLSHGPSQARTDTFPDHAALELGEHARHLEHRLAGRRPCVEALLMQEQVDPERIQLG
jgi:hypothetical protein